MPLTQAETQSVKPVTVSTTVRTRAFNIPSLDGIRGLAFLFVFLAHTGLGWVIPGGFGVTVFFLLSGFLITTLLRIEYDEHNHIDLKAFYLRRFFRILPLFYFVILAATLLCAAGVLGGVVDAGAIAAQVFQYANYYLCWHVDRVVQGMQVYWSLAVEEHFYLLFPLLYLLTRRRMRRTTQAGLLLGACVLALGWRYVNIYALHFATVHNELTTDGRFDSILYGCVLAIGLNPVLDTSPWLTRKRLAPLALLGVALLLFTFGFRNENFRYTLRYTLQGLALMPLFAYAMLARGTLVFRILNSRPLMQLGALSYALYLEHYIVLRWFEAHLKVNSVVLGLITFPIILLIGKALQVAIEAPMLRLKKKYVRVHAPAQKSAIAS